MKQTAVEWLVEQILTEVQNYEDGDIETESEPFKHEYINKYIGMVDLSQFVNKAKEMEKQQLIMFGAQCMVEVEKESGLGAIKIYELYFDKTFKSE